MLPHKVCTVFSMRVILEPIFYFIFVFTLQDKISTQCPGQSWLDFSSEIEQELFNLFLVILKKKKKAFTSRMWTKFLYFLTASQLKKQRYKFSMHMSFLRFFPATSYQEEVNRIPVFTRTLMRCPPPHELALLLCNFIDFFFIIFKMHL